VEVVAALDANILVRYLVQDDEAQFAAAKKLIQSALSANERLYIPTTVTLELEWVLRSNYHLDKDQVMALLTNPFCAGEKPFWTFDQKAAKIEGAQCLVS
jgi:predicted nucleic-acid-binding protein